MAHFWGHFKAPCKHTNGEPNPSLCRCLHRLPDHSHGQQDNCCGECCLYLCTIFSSLLQPCFNLHHVGMHAGQQYMEYHSHCNSGQSNVKHRGQGERMAHSLRSEAAQATSIPPAWVDIAGRLQKPLDLILDARLAHCSLSCAFCVIQAWQIYRSLDVDYVFVVFGGVIGYPSDDINKFLWMVRCTHACLHPRLMTCTHAVCFSL